MLGTKAGKLYMYYMLALFCYHYWQCYCFLDSRPVLSNIVATSNIWLFKFNHTKLKIHSSVCTSLISSAQYLCGAGGYRIGSSDTEHFHHCRKLYQTVRLSIKEKEIFTDK